MAKEEPVPDEQRCKRTDGRHWRCKRSVMEGKLLCEIHFAQVRLRNDKIRVPDSLKLQRSNRTSTKNPRSSSDAGDGETRVTGREHLDRKNKRKHSSAEEVDDLDDKTAKDKAEELLRTIAKKKIDGRKKKVKTEEGIEKEKIKKRKKAKKNVVTMAGEQSGEEITRELPFGRMAISPMPESVKASAAKPIGNAASLPAKLGLENSNHRLVNRRFRSKNVEQPPISTVKAVPYAGNLKVRRKVAGSRGARRKCHWCQKNGNVSLTKCLTCKKRSFCSACIKKRSVEAQEVKLKCPVCHGTCDCSACLISHPKDAGSEDNLNKPAKMSKSVSLHYMMSLILPFLEQMNEEQTIELEMEAKLKEQSLSEVEIQRAEIGEKKQISCNKCSSFILDMYRSCLNCLYNLCLSCCQETRGLMLQGSQCPSRKKIAKDDDSLNSDSLGSLSSSRVYNGKLVCPSLECNDCTSSILDLRCIFPLNYTRELEISAKEMILSQDSPKAVGPSLQCSFCSTMAREGGSKKELLEASRRKHPGDNFLYWPSIHDDHDILLAHFQKHWRNCHPVIVRDLLGKVSDLTWDPIAMFSNYLKMVLSRSENDNDEAGDPNCNDWYKADFSNKESFTESLMKVTRTSYETLKLKAKLSSLLCQRGFSAHYAEILKNLPIQEYTNPSSGLLNLAAKSAEDSQVSEFNPHIHITCGSVEDIQREELVDALCQSSHDLINILVHASDFSASTDQANEVKKLLRMKAIKDMGGCNGLDLDNGLNNEHSKITKEAGQPEKSVNGIGPNSETESDSSVMCSGITEPSPSEKKSGEDRPCGIQWDIFRRQDAPKLLEYLQRHSDEFYNQGGSLKQAVDHNILDGSFFLDGAHKMKLKQEFKIEPWTFNQKLGEAVFLPAGCPYQTRNLKSSVNVVLGFISPENAGECIKLSDKQQGLPIDHKWNASGVKVQKMVIDNISKGIEEIRSEAGKDSS